MKSLNLFALAILSVLFFSGCTSVQVDRSYNPDGSLANETRTAEGWQVSDQNAEINTNGNCRGGNGCGAGGTAGAPGVIVPVQGNNPLSGLLGGGDYRGDRDGYRGDSRHRRGGSAACDKHYAIFRKNDRGQELKNIPSYQRVVQCYDKYGSIYRY